MSVTRTRAHLDGVDDGWSGRHSCAGVRALTFLAARRRLVPCCAPSSGFTSSLKVSDRALPRTVGITPFWRRRNVLAGAPLTRQLYRECSRLLVRRHQRLSRLHNEFVLVNASMAKSSDSGATGTAGTSASAASETAYELTGENESKAGQYVGRRVEISGTLMAAEVSPSSKPTGGATAGKAA
jgi:hypothetical protein